MENLSEAIHILKNGGIVIFPTDTAFGVGCRLDRPQAIKRLFQIRKRPETQATPILVSSLDMAKKYLQSVTAEVQQLMQKYWPGGLTIIYPCNKALVPSLVRGGGSTLGVRMPDHETTQVLINGVGMPLLGPSANFHGLPTPFTFEELDPELIKLVDFVLPGECKTKQVSTVIDCTQTPWKILRQGVMKVAAIKTMKTFNLTLCIDTSGSSETTVRLRKNDIEKEFREETSETKSQNVLPLIAKALQTEKILLTDLTHIEVNTGPGSFTGVRVGVAVANTLAWALKILVNNKTLEAPRYTESKFD